MNTLFIKDLNFLNAVKKQLGIEHDPTIEEVSKIEVLIADNYQIENVEGIQYFTGAREIDFHDNFIKDISPFSELVQLERLELGNNPIEDITPLENLTNLFRLAIGFNYTTDSLEPLRKLKKLKYFFVCSDQLTDISPLEDLEQLVWVKICNNKITDISVLEKLPNLKLADLSCNPLNLADAKTKSVVANLNSQGTFRFEDHF